MFQPDRASADDKSKAPDAGLINMLRKECALTSSWRPEKSAWMDILCARMSNRRCKKNDIDFFVSHEIKKKQKYKFLPYPLDNDRAFSGRYLFRSESKKKKKKKKKKRCQTIE